ncbi:hypothetical protein, conserved in T. vivax [Trypanosoma vivax Y486]|uniref:Uncharacterized protein n=1 Tax=Trypanosoma vivax (strain Y486) TaxID=1055687 RepID=F9WQC0_TRYVY|nr:hypothetical protein, conserved in T. vivax [Trypanosoma vivax Y486]|eukprot:CCD19747.1 hypothetical protein, conserved in T. vivax [Trypanosoma vivax Y486]
MYQFAKNGHSDSTDGDTFTTAKRAKTHHQARHATAPSQTPYPKRRDRWRQRTWDDALGTRQATSRGT